MCNQHEDMHGLLKSVSARLELMSLELAAAEGASQALASGEQQDTDSNLGLAPSDDASREVATGVHQRPPAEHQSKDLEPVPLHAHMATSTRQRFANAKHPKPESVWEAKAVENARRIQQRWGAGGSRTSSKTSENLQVVLDRQVPDKLDASVLGAALHQKLNEMKELLDSLMLGEISSPAAGWQDKRKPMAEQLQGEGGDAAGGKPRALAEAPKAVANSLSPSAQDRAARSVTSGGQDHVHELRGRAVRQVAPEHIRFPIEDMDEDEC